MSGIYIHIPFCASRCIYCGFYSTTGMELRQKYVDVVCKEMTMREVSAPIETIYLGGGTPSQLTSEQLRQLFLCINKVYAPCATEVTIEMNPDDVTPEYAETLSQLGVNRVSMGAQTFNDERLRFLRRRHSSSQVYDAVRILRDAGVRNISVDLMYGFPGETVDGFRCDIDASLALDVEHISAYCLMIEEGTALHRLDIEAADEETERAMYEMLIDRLVKAGYEHYEISNFARRGFRSRHNSSYWNDTPYIGLGAAAHSYDGHCRSWNVADIHTYIAAIERGELPSECEELDIDTKYNDRIATALRTCDGLNLGELDERHRQYCLTEAQRFIDDGLLKIVDNYLRLTRRGLFVSNMVMSELMLV